MGVCKGFVENGGYVVETLRSFVKVVRRIAEISGDSWTCCGFVEMHGGVVERLCGGLWICVETLWRWCGGGVDICEIWYRFVGICGSFR